MSKKSKLKRQIKKLEAQLKRKGLKRIPAKGGAIHVKTKATDAEQFAAGIKNKSSSTQPFKIPDTVMAFSRESKARVASLASRIYQAAKPMPGVVPAEHQTMAMDEAIKRSADAAAMALDEQVMFGGGWGGAFGGYGAFAEGQMFLGYPYLSELAQRPEYRVISETTATEMTRKWIKIKARGDSGDKAKQIQELEDEFKRLRVKEEFCKCAEYDGFMGRHHLFLDFGDDGPEELKTSVGDGNNDVSEVKIKEGSLKRIKSVEAMWCYPANYNCTNPLDPDWYDPQLWFVMAQQIHASRLLTFVGREVPDILKPAYSFGGLSMSQMAKPYVDNFLRGRQSGSDLLHAFTVWALGTNLTALMTEGGDKLIERVMMFNNMRDNKGMFLTDKETEELKNISAELSTVDLLIAQAQEQICSVARTPTVKLLGIDAHGLNASSEGSIRTYYDSIHAQQPKLFGSNLDRIFRFAQINLWGKIDPDLIYEWEQLWSLDEKGKAEVRKVDADTDAVLVDIGAMDATEVRERVAADEDSPHASLDLNKTIEAPEEIGGGKMLGLGQGGGIGGSGSSFKEAAE